jgi:uroporphyrinogen-III synthase
VRALVTRPAEDAAPLARALAERGIDALLQPLLAIHPVGDAGRRLGEALAGAQALLFTSANGVRAVVAASPRRELPVFAVGDASAAAARIAGFRSVASAGGDVADLARLVAARLAPQRGPLVHAAGSEVAGDLEALLPGFTLRRAVLYEARAADALLPETVAALRRGALDLALFFSPRTAATFVSLAAAQAVGDTCRAVTAIGLSAAVAARLGALPWRALRTAAAPTQGALLAALDRAVAEQRQMGTA